MINVTVDREALSISATGHARAKRNEHGHDLVCAAVSTLMQGYAYAGTRSGHIMEVDMDKGHMVARIDPDTTASQGMRYILEGYALGLQMVAENYPESLKISVV